MAGARLEKAKDRCTRLEKLVTAGAMDKRVDEMEVAGTFKKPIDLDALLETLDRLRRPADAA